MSGGGVERIDDTDETASRSLPLADCTLDADGLAAQLARYRRLGGHARTVERLADRVLVKFDDDVPTGLVELALSVERGCCPYIRATVDPDRKELTMTVETATHTARLHSLCDAIARGRTEDDPELRRSKGNR